MLFLFLTTVGYERNSIAKPFLPPSASCISAFAAILCVWLVAVYIGFPWYILSPSFSLPFGWEDYKVHPIQFPAHVTILLLSLR